MSTYILQKDMPNLSKGTEFKKADNGWYYVDKDNFGMYYSIFSKVVENNPEWFKLKEDPYIVLNIFSYTGIKDELQLPYLKVVLNKDVSCKEFRVVKQVIEGVLNGDIKLG